MKRKFLLLTIGLALIALIAVACQPQTETVEVTRIVTETIVEEGEEVEVTRIVTEQVEVEVEVTRIVEVEVPAEPEPEEFTLVLWFLSGSPEEIEDLQALADQWAASYDKADVTVDFSPFGFEDWNNAMKLALDGGTGPDVFYGSPGPIRLQAFGQAGHIVDLKDIITERGWDELHNIDVLNYWDSSPDHTWGVAYEVVTVGVYYNQDIYDEFGLEPPTTLEEFEEQMATFQEAGLTPLVVGGADGWPLMHVFDQITHFYVPNEDLAGQMILDPDFRWDSPEMLQSAAKLKEWVDAGYFDLNAVATAYQDANTLFASGESPLYIQGTWNNQTFSEQPEFEARFFPMPPPADSSMEWHMGGFTPNNAWGVPVYSEHQEAGLDFIEFILGPEVSQARWDKGNIPSALFAEVPEPVYPLQADVYAATQAGGTGFYSDGSAGEISEVLYSGLQDLFAGRTDPQGLIDSVQEVYEQVLAEQE